MQSFVGSVLFAVNSAINIALPFLYAIGIYDIWNNYIYAAVGALIFWGLSHNPITALLAYPAFEFFVIGHLSLYGSIIVSLTAVQAAFVFGMMFFQRHHY